MNVDEYISSGILIDYCLNFLTDEEKNKVEMMCEIYPEISNELKLLKTVLENYLISRKIWNKSELRLAIAEAINKMKEGDQ